MAPARSVCRSAVGALRGPICPQLKRDPLGGRDMILATRRKTFARTTTTPARLGPACELRSARLPVPWEGRCREAAV